MGIPSVNTSKDQAKRLKIKTLGQQMAQRAITGVGLSQWEANVLVEEIEDVFFTDASLQGMKPGQIQYCCVSAKEGAGKPLKDCEMSTVVLSLLGDSDFEGLEGNDKTRQQSVRQRRLMRISEEAKDQGGLLSQEDLAKLLMCDVKSIRRDVKSLKEQEIIVPTRGQQKDIGPGLTHRELIVRKWLEGHEETAICTLTKHSMKSVENYLGTFKKVVYLRESKKFTTHEIAVVVGCSSRLAQSHIDSYHKLKNHGISQHRLEEIELIGSQYYREKGEKKDSSLQSPSKKGCKVK